MSGHDNDSYDVTTGIMLTVKEKLDNISVRFKLWKINPLLAGSVLIIAAVAVILGIAIAKENEPVFSSPCESGFEERFITRTKNKVTVSMRVSDMGIYDPDRKRAIPTLEYSSNSDEVAITADFIFTNNGKEDFTFGNAGGIALGYAKDVKYKKDGRNDAYAVIGFLYSEENDSYEGVYSIRVAPGETVEKRFRFIYPAEYADKIVSLYICRPWVDDNHEVTVFEVMGVGEPFLTFRLNNQKLFPALTKI
ncbi:MAG: hypothetical protein MR038_05350 [Oscillospiraceae bacterium]|nr:hypothetical protein [Oscillospiraceae bacterium]